MSESTVGPQQRPSQTSTRTNARVRPSAYDRAESEMAPLLRRTESRRHLAMAREHITERRINELLQGASRDPPCDTPKGAGVRADVRD